MYWNPKSGTFWRRWYKAVRNMLFNCCTVWIWNVLSHVLLYFPHTEACVWKIIQYSGDGVLQGYAYIQEMHTSRSHVSSEGGSLIVSEKLSTKDTLAFHHRSTRTFMRNINETQQININRSVLITGSYTAWKPSAMIAFNGPILQRQYKVPDLFLFQTQDVIFP